MIPPVAWFYLITIQWNDSGRATTRTYRGSVVFEHQDVTAEERFLRTLEHAEELARIPAGTSVVIFYHCERQ